MAANNVDIKITATGAAAAASEVNKVKTAVSGLSQEAPKTTNAFVQMNDAFLMVKNTINAFMGVAIVKEIIGLGSACIDAAIAAQEVKESFIAMTGSMESAETVIRGIQDIKDLGVFTRGDVNTAAQALLRMGMTAEQVGPAMHSLANYAAGTYRSLDSVVSAYVRCAETGEVTRRQLLTFGSQLGTDFRDKVRAGTATIDDLNRALEEATRKGGQFADALNTRALEPESAFLRLKNHMTDLKVIMGNALLPIVSSIADDFNRMFTNVNREGYFARFINGVREVLRLFGQISGNPVFQMLLNMVPLQKPEGSQTPPTGGPGMGGAGGGGGGAGGGTPDTNRKAIWAAKQGMFIGETGELDSWYQGVLDSHKQMEEAAAKQNFEYFSNVVKAAQTMGGEMNKIFNQIGINEKIQLENTYNKRKRIIMAVITDETKQKEALAALDAQQEARQRKMAHEQAIRNKALAIMNAIINTAVGVTGALSTAAGQWWGAIAMAAIIGALGIAQVGLIAAQPIPEAAEGAFIRGSASGSLLRAGERGNSEAVLPLDNPEAMGKLGGIGGATVNINIENLYGKEVPQWFAIEIDKALYKLQQSKNSTFGRALS